MKRRRNGVPAHIGHGLSRLWIITLFILSMGLYGCDAGALIGETEGSDVGRAFDGAEGHPVVGQKTGDNAFSVAPAYGYVIGFSNTRATAAATTEIGYGSTFSPTRYRKLEPKTLVEYHEDPRQHIIDAIHGQQDYYTASGLQPGFVYWMVGVRDQNTPGASIAQKRYALELLHAIWATTGGIPILINPMSDYVEGHICTTSGIFGPDVAEELVDYLEAQEPDMFIRIARFATLDPSETVDGCHPTEEIYERDAQMLVDEIYAALGG